MMHRAGAANTLLSARCSFALRTIELFFRSCRAYILLRRGFLIFRLACPRAAQPSEMIATARKEVVMRRQRQQNGAERAATEGRLTARPGEPSAEGALGSQALGLDGRRDALLYVPAGYTADQPAPLALMLHGAGGNAGHGMALLQQLADATGIIVLAPASRQGTWDVIYGGYGPDIAFMDRALTTTFSRYAVDPTHVAVGGFSDGASYALSVGITNGDLFTHVIAFSPGFMAPADQVGAPRIYVSHGTHDEVLPIDRCSRRIVPQLERAGYAVRYREFNGPHTVPVDIGLEAVGWFTGEQV